MTVKQALKQKNKLVEEINGLWNAIKTVNSIEVGNPKHYSVPELMKEAVEKTKQLVALKAQIHKANTPVYDKIFEMSELKSTVKQLKTIPTDEGKIAGRYGSAPETKEVQLNSKQIKDMIKSVQDEIDVIQDTLDIHNATTQI